MTMIRKIATTLVAVFVVASAASLHAEDKTPAAKAPKELKPQTLCPVMGKPIDSTAYTDIQGQRVYHCCPMCSKKLMADPDTYFKKAAADGVLFENIQTNCPVSGEKLEDSANFTDFEGRRIYFCCAKCEKSFKADPQKFLKKMDAAADKKAEPMKDDHQEKGQESGHGSH